MGNASVSYSKLGYGYAMEKADTTVDGVYSFLKKHLTRATPTKCSIFIDCVQNDKQPVITGEDGRAVLEIIYAAYASAREGKKIMLPFLQK
jgi:predicted dehydrogenase